MKQVKTLLLFSIAASLSLAPVIEAINTQNLKQKAKGLGWSVLSLGSAALVKLSWETITGSHRKAKEYDQRATALHALVVRNLREGEEINLVDRTTIDQCVDLGNLYKGQANLTLALGCLAVYGTYKFAQKAVQAFKKKPEQQPA